MEEKNQKKNNQGERQSWEPHGAWKFLRGVWMVAFSAFKIAVGAAATVLCICIVCGLVFIGLLGQYLEEDVIPNADFALENFELDQTSFLYYVDSDGSIQQLQRIYTTTNRQWVPFDELPEDLIHAAVAIEDKRFYEHQGVDWITTIKACVGMFVGDGGAGGSTITQQLIKNLTEENSVTVQRKVMEWFRAAAFEKHYDKDVIMEWYLNTIFLGEGCYGVKSAAATYFGKEIQTLTAAECASLVSITKNPSRFGPYIDNDYINGAEENKKRRETVLWQMCEQGYLTEEEYAEALAEELIFRSGINDDDRYITCINEDCGYGGIKLTYNLEDDGLYHCPQCGIEVPMETDASQEVYSWFVEAVLDDVAMDLAEKDGMDWNSNTQKIYMEKIRKGGYHIYTTLDMEVQEQVDHIYQNLDEIPDTRSAQQLQSAIVVTDNRTGDIVAMAGGVGNDKGFDDFNIATDSELQTGSSIKPLTIYAPAFELGAITPATVIKDLPLNYNSGRAFPRNDNRKYNYSRTIFKGVASSINAVAVNTLDMIGLTASYNWAKYRFHLNGLTDHYVRESDGFVMSDIDYSPLGMGALTLGVSVRDMTNAYGAFANNGVWREGRTYTKVYDSKGNLVIDNVQNSEQILSEKTVNYMNYCLAEVVASGTGTRARLSSTMACGKTGTTTSSKDKWFCGFTSYYTAAVWCGYKWPEQIYVTDGSGSNPAVVLWKKVMEPLHQDKQYVKMYDQSGMVNVAVCLDSGKLATDACALDVRSGRTTSALVYREDKPTETCDKHVAVDYCVTGGGVANEYCKHFADAGAAVIEKRALVKMTQKEVEEIKKAAKFGLVSEYLRNDYIYLVDEDGRDLNFRGINGNANAGVNAPYITCTVHTKAAWEEYQGSNQTEPDPEPTFTWPWG